MKFDLFCPSPGPQGAGTQKVVPLHVPFMQVTHTPTMFEFRFFLTPQTSTVPPSSTPGALSRWQNENPV